MIIETRFSSPIILLEIDCFFRSTTLLRKRTQPRTWKLVWMPVRKWLGKESISWSSTFGILEMFCWLLTPTIKNWGLLRACHRWDHLLNQVRLEHQQWYLHTPQGRRIFMYPIGRPIGQQCHHSANYLCLLDRL